MKFGPELHWLTKVFRRSQKKTFLPVSYVLYEAFYSESAYSKNSRTPLDLHHDYSKLVPTKIRRVDDKILARCFNYRNYNFSNIPHSRRNIGLGTVEFRLLVISIDVELNWLHFYKILLTSNFKEISIIRYSPFYFLIFVLVQPGISLMVL